MSAQPDFNVFFPLLMDQYLGRNGLICKKAGQFWLSYNAEFNSTHFKPKITPLTGMDLERGIVAFPQF